MAEKLLILSNLKIYTEKEVLQDSCLIIADDKIHAIIPQQDIKHHLPADVLEFLPTYHLLPGFIDMHIHGANGSDVMDATPEALTNISQALVKEGATSYLATTMTASPEEIENTLCVVRDVMNKQEETRGAKILGVHLEGPFLSPKKVGAQRADKILSPKKEYIERWQKLSDCVIKLVTIAPELPNSLEFIRYLKEQKIIASIGHTDATYAESVDAIAAGCTHATHLFNAMRGIHQREPGTVTAVLLAEKVMAELILDGVHLQPAIVQMILRLKAASQLVLVTDAMRAKCLSDGDYDLGGQMVAVKNEVATLADGTLAGSVLKMNVALKNLLRFTNCKMTDAIKMTSENPARALGVFTNKGSIAVNKDADLVVLDDQFEVVLTISEGRIVYKSESEPVVS